MIKLTLPRNTVTPGGLFFDQVVEASLRGNKIKYIDNFNTAILLLETNEFFSKNDIINIINSGGDVEQYPIYVRMTKEKYDNLLLSDLNINITKSEDIILFKEVFDLFDEISDTEIVVCMTPNTTHICLSASTVLNMFPTTYTNENSTSEWFMDIKEVSQLIANYISIKNNT